MAVTIVKGDTPNQQRVKINSNLSDLSTEVNNKLNIDGSNAMLAPLPMSGNRITDVGNGLLDTDAVNLGQMNNVANRLVQQKCAYVINGYLGTEVIYVDGTSNWAVKVGDINDAFTAINSDTSTGDEWTIVVGPGKYGSVKFYNLPINTDIVGTGNVEISADTDLMIPTTTTINSSGNWKGVKVKSSVTGKLIIKGKPKIEDCVFYAPTANISLQGTNIETSKLIAKSGSQIELDSTSVNYVNWCSISGDFTGSGVYDYNTQNIINTELETYYNF